MEKNAGKEIEKARNAAIEVLEHNASGPYYGLPRAAGWGYPEPYTRDLMICVPGILSVESKRLKNAMVKVFQTIQRNQTPLGHVPSLVHDSEDRGASDTTPLFLFAVGCYRMATGQDDFLKDCVERALTWMRYQSPADRCLVAQLPTSDWRDEQWVLGYGLFVNTVVYSYLRLLGQHEQAQQVRKLMARFTIEGGVQQRRVHEGLAVKQLPYYAWWSYKIYSSSRFDLLGNSIAILCGIASQNRAEAIIHWIEHECTKMKNCGELAVDLPPNFFPFIKPGDDEWRPRYEQFNQPGDYHNGGIWPFVCGFYIAALVAAGRYRLAEKKLIALTALVQHVREAPVSYGFNEWIQAQTAKPMGQDWQSWSAAMYLYASQCVALKRTPFFDEIRQL